MAFDVSTTKVIVQRFDKALRQIATLQRQNNDLNEIIRDNELKALKLIDHYQSDIDAQTNLATKLKSELRARDELERLKRQRNFREQGTEIEDDELQEAREKELLDIIYLLEDEISSLKDDQIKQNEDFERRTLASEANVKQSFLKDIDAFRAHISDSVCDEVREALAATIADNERLTREYRLVLRELEKIQISRDQKDKELRRTRWEMEFLQHKNQLMATRVQHHISEEQRRKCDMRSLQRATSDCAGAEDGNERKRKAAAGLEEYLRQCIRNNTQKNQSTRKHRQSRVSL